MSERQRANNQAQGPLGRSPQAKLEVTAYGLKGADAAKFTEIANLAESKCPVSNAYRGTMQITVDAKVG